MKKPQKYRKSRKLLTSQEASQKIENTKTQIQVSQEFIDFCEADTLSGICLSVAIREFGTVENAIQFEKEKIKWCYDKINDLKRFL